MVAAFKPDVSIDRCLTTRDSDVQVASHDNGRLGSNPEELKISKTGQLSF